MSRFWQLTEDSAQVGIIGIHLDKYARNELQGTRGECSEERESCTLTLIVSVAGDEGTAEGCRY